MSEYLDSLSEGEIARGRAADLAETRRRLVEASDAAAEAEQAAGPGADPGKCPGCGNSFRGQRGLRSHQTAPFVTLACRA